ncbi:short chain dehydrogenase/reductase family [Massariosphaeria phaeospora]|uniref:Short chain dehydrogenase/reductase family n=1 Tax=Massariosphaeria phaeospora TaxID=100035 RepID=A0A7C8M6W7_9PLEO|nr:short chain dehydrogenase/reductase family [Massariosphaeria phaeospora]
MAALESSQLFGVQHVVAVVTGGGSGIGKMIATALAANGATCVYIIGRDEEKLRQTADRYPNVIKPLAADVTSQDSLRAAANIVQQEVGYINLLVPNAGTAGPPLKGLTARPSVSDFVRAAWSSPPVDFTQVYGLNCTGLYYTILAFLELLDEGNKRRSHHPKSQVVATASMASFLRDARYGFAYSSSKAAVVSLIKTFATYCVPWGIRFNAIALGLFPSDMSTPLLTPFKISKEKDISEEGALARSYIPAERAGSNEDIAGVFLYLASRAGSYVNGSVMLVDGGKVATMPASY